MFIPENLMNYVLGTPHNQEFLLTNKIPLNYHASGNGRIPVTRKKKNVVAVAYTSIIDIYDVCIVLYSIGLFPGPWAS